ILKHAHGEDRGRENMQTKTQWVVELSRTSVSDAGPPVGDAIQREHIVDHDGNAECKSDPFQARKCLDEPFDTRECGRALSDILLKLSRSVYADTELGGAGLSKQVQNLFVNDAPVGHDHDPYLIENPTIV